MAAPQPARHGTSLRSHHGHHLLGPASLLLHPGVALPARGYRLRPDRLSRAGLDWLSVSSIPPALPTVSFADAWYSQAADVSCSCSNKHGLPLFAHRYVRFFKPVFSSCVSAHWLTRDYLLLTFRSTSTKARRYQGQKLGHCRCNSLPHTCHCLSYLDLSGRRSFESVHLESVCLDLVCSRTEEHAIE